MIERDNQSDGTSEALLEAFAPATVLEATQALPPTDLLAASLACLPQAILITRDEQVLYINHEFTRLFGYTPEELVGRQMASFQHPSAQPEEFSLILQMVHARGRAALDSVRHTKDGEAIEVCLSCAPLISDGTFIGYILSYRDIRDQKQSTAQLEHDALHDALTGLPNRALFLDRLKLAMARRSRRRDAGCGVIFLDLDKFKEINDNRGHCAGDALLVEVANRLSGTIRPQDTAARLSGDEFALLLDHVQTVDDMGVVATRVQAELERSFEILGHTVHVGASLGVALCGGEHRVPEQLVRDADFAMYRAKQQGGHRFEIFDRYMQVHISSQQEQERELRRVLDKREYAIWYQPFYRLESGRLEGFEALLRWRRANGVFESFHNLLETAEGAGLTITLNRETMLEACRQLHSWSAEWPKAAFSLSINLSGRQFYHAEMLSLVNAVLSRSAVDPARLLFEIPETVLNEAPEAATQVLARLSERGVRIAIDRFGAGLAPVNHLLQMPVDLIKFDQRLTAASAEGGRASAVLSGLIQMGSALGITTLAQGVEHGYQEEALREMGCDLVQGFLFSSAVSAESTRGLIAEGRWATQPAVPAANTMRTAMPPLNGQPTFGPD
jgi:Amt family ammonium transporter